MAIFSANLYKNFNNESPSKNYFSKVRKIEIIRLGEDSKFVL